MTEETRAKIGKGELVERLIDAALEQPQPCPDLARALQGYLTFTKHRHRDRSRDRMP